MRFYSESIEGRASLSRSAGSGLRRRVASCRVEDSRGNPCKAQNIAHRSDLNFRCVFEVFG